mmetsp:Transcript_102409/g.319027  ORF Transcript_102409/g.319027 Transcript_102409/m.319027 type:complete len:360 (-) Transcript_102409:134-1213(-)
MDGCEPSSPSPELPEPLADLDVPVFLRPYGYSATSHMSWGRQQPPELAIQVSHHSTIGKHTYYHLECTLTRVREPEEKRAWKVSRRLAHLREGLHDPLKRALGSSYQTYFSGVHFAHHLRPSGTTSRLDSWCRRLAHCITAKLAPPEIAAAALRVLAAPTLAERSEQGGNRGGTGNADPPARVLEIAGLTSGSGLPGCCGAVGVGNITGLLEYKVEGGGTGNADPPARVLEIAGLTSGSGLPGCCGAVGVGNITGLLDYKVEGGDDGDGASLDPDKDTLASEGASASTADPSSGGVVASWHPAYGAVASPGGTSDSSADSGDEDGTEALDDEDLAEAVGKVAEPAFDPFCGRRRPVALQ